MITNTRRRYIAERQETSMDQVGIVGYGAMGTAFAERLVKSGNRPMIYDVDEDARQRAEKDGLKVFDSASELGAVCDLVDIIVRTDEELLDATIGPEGSARDAKSGTILLLHSSVLPKTTFKIAEEVEPRGIKVVDACATGQPKDISAGTLIFLVGASPELADQVRPHLLRMAKHVLHMGPLGAGNVAKLIKNLLTASERLVIWEALEIGEKAGISYTQSLNMMRLAFTEHSGGQLKNWEQVFDASGASLVPKSGTNLYNKDVPLAAELARSYGLDLPITEQLTKKSQLLVELNAQR